MRKKNEEIPPEIVTWKQQPPNLMNKKNLEMATKAIAGLRSERAETKRPVRNVAIDSITARRWQAHTFSSTTTCTDRTYLKPP